MPRKDQSADPFDLEAALDDLESSGLSTAAFARERGVAAWKLYEGLRRRRKRRLAERAVRSSPAFVPVQLAARPPSSGVVEVELRCGRVLRVPEACEESALLRLVRALESC
jgi:hypothetical protein